MRCDPEPGGQPRSPQAAERHLSHGCVGAFQSAEWALVKWLTGTEVVDQALNDQQGTYPSLPGVSLCGSSPMQCVCPVALVGELDMK